MQKRLERKTEQAIFFGVLAGMAEYFNQDPVLFRVVAIVLLIITGFFPGTFFYIAAAILMPRAQSTDNRSADYEIVE